MEKFRKFADPKTGKHPYLPQITSPTTSDLIVGLILLLPRLFIYIWFQLIILLKSKLISPNRLLSSKIEQILYKVMFLIMGMKIKEVNPEDKRIDGDACIYLTNFSSHFDPLIVKSW